MPISPPAWSDVELLFDEALDLDEGACRALIETVRGTDPQLATEVQALLLATMAPPGELDASVAELLGEDFLDALAGPAEKSLAVGHRVGAYRIVSVLGMGGMGRVFLAERADGHFEQMVALKVLRWDASSPEIVERFKQERQLLATLDHPGITRLVDGGVTDDGLPYLIMDWVDGIPIDEYCAVHALTLKDRIRLFLDVCASVQYAHANLIVHRDLKPPNILVTEEGQPKLLDFGVAKLMDASAAPLTLHGSVPLTPKYAAPEQILRGTVTTVTDVYTLGVLLHELLTGMRPHEGGDPSPGELVRRIGEGDPGLPSVSVHRAGPTDAAAGFPPSSALRGDLDSILIKALQRRPEDRYSSVDQLADDLRRYLRSEPVLAQDAGLFYQLRRFTRRHRVGVVATLAVMTSLGVGTGVALSQARQATVESERARAAGERADRIATALGSIFDVANPNAGSGAANLTARDLLDQGIASSRASFAADPDLLASMLTILGRGYVRIGAIEEGQQHLTSAITLLGDEGDPLTLAAAFTGLGDAASVQRRFATADTAYQEALTLHRSVAEPDALEEAILLGAIAGAKAARGQASEARALNEQVLEMLTPMLSESDPLVLKARSRGALISRVEGDLAEAESVYRDVLRIQRDNLGPFDPALPETLNNLAYLLVTRGALSEADDIYRASLTILEMNLGNAHPTTMLVRQNLASALATAGQLSEAETLLLRNLEVAKVESPEGDKGVDTALRTLVGAYLSWSQASQAEGRVHEMLALPITRSAAQVAFLDLDLALSLSLQGRRNEADVLRAAAFRTIRGGGAMNRAAQGRLSWLARIADENGEPALATLHRDFLSGLTNERR